MREKSGVLEHKLEVLNVVAKLAWDGELEEDRDNIPCEDTKIIEKNREVLLGQADNRELRANIKEHPELKDIKLHR